METQSWWIWICAKSFLTKTDFLLRHLDLGLQVVIGFFWAAPCNQESKRSITLFIGIEIPWCQDLKHTQTCWSVHITCLHSLGNVRECSVEPHMNPKKAVLVAPLESFWNHRGMAWGNHQPPKSPSPFGEVLMPDDAWYGVNISGRRMPKANCFNFCSMHKHFQHFHCCPSPAWSNTNILSKILQLLYAITQHSLNLSLRARTTLQCTAYDPYISALAPQLVGTRIAWNVTCQLCSILTPDIPWPQWPLLTAPQPAVLVSGPLLSFRVPVELLGPQPWPCWPCSPSNVSTCLNMSQQRISRWEGSIW